MDIVIHKDIQDLLEELNEIGEAKLFGGYLRARHKKFNHTPNDADIVTNIPIDVIAEKYKHLEKAKQRVTTSGHDVFSFKMHRTEKIFVEIVSIDTDLLDKARHADYTINSLLYDGKDIIDIMGGLDDIERKIIREVDADIIREDLRTRPYLWLKTLRLVSMMGFDLSKITFDILNENKECIENISAEIMQTEGHKTLNGRNPFKAMKFLSEMGFIQPFEVNGFKEQEIAIQPQQKLCLLAILSNKQSVDDFAKFYKFQPDLITKYERLYEIYVSGGRPPSRFKNQIITIKKFIEQS